MGFKDLKQQSDETAGRPRGTTEGRNVALRVTSYDLEAKRAVGIDLQTGEEMSISLRPDPNAATRKFKRADVDDWSGTGKGGKRNKSYTEEGGVIMFEGVYKYPEGFTARWGTSLSHTPDESEVFVAYASPLVTKAKKYGVDVVKPMAAAAVTTLDEFKVVLENALSIDTFSSAMVRAFDGEEVVHRRVTRSKRDEAGQYSSMSPAEAVEAFLQTPWGKKLGENIGKDFTTEVIPVERIYAGRDTREALGTEQHFQRHYVMGQGVGFAESIITGRRHPEGGFFLSAEPMPVSTVPKLFAVENIPTPNVQPKVGAFVNKAGTEEASDADLGAVAPSPSETEAAIAKKVNAAAASLRPR